MLSLDSRGRILLERVDDFHGAVVEIEGLHGALRAIDGIWTFPLR
jgi:hypothetical protein